VVRGRGGALSGIDAVIDKDLAAALLAEQLGADALLILTDVPRAYIHYNTPEQQALAHVTASEMEAYAAAGHFKAGSMGPKVAACLRFVRAGGEAVIASLTEVVVALEGAAGTHIVPGAAAKKRPPRPAGAATKAGPARAAVKSNATAAPSEDHPGAASTGRAGRKPAARRPAGGKAKPAGAEVIDIGHHRRKATGGSS
jgi:glutamate 5-kinase